TNNEPNDITMVNVSFFLEQYMSQPKFCGTRTVLKKGESADIPVTAFFNETMLNLIENITANGKIIVEYRSLGSVRRTEIPMEIPVYHRNAMSWDDDRRAASFVSARDPAAQWFSRYVSGLVQSRMRPGINRNIQYALGLFEILNIYGINYVVDPSSSYIELSESSSSLDSLNYPYQTLMYRGGDCDDLSILFCSLLEAAGIETAFVTIPGHIYMAFDSGLTEDEARRDFYAPEEFVYQGGKVWVPLEITIPREGFYRAWRIGAKEWRDASARDAAALYPMRDSWKTYPPVSVPGAASRFALPPEERSSLAFDRSMDAWISYEIRPQVRALENRLVQGENAETRNALGVLYGRYGMMEKAEEQFALAARAGSVHGRVNLGNAAFLGQRYEEGLGYYYRVLQDEPENSIATLGMARSYYELNDFSSSDWYYAKLHRNDRALAEEYAYLGSFFESRGRAWSLADRLDTTPWSLPSAKAPEPEAAPPKEEAPAPASGLVTQLAVLKDDSPPETPPPPAPPITADARPPAEAPEKADQPFLPALPAASVAGIVPRREEGFSDPTAPAGTAPAGPAPAPATAAPVVAAAPAALAPATAVSAAPAAPVPATASPAPAMAVSAAPAAPAPATAASVAAAEAATPAVAAPVATATPAPATAVSAAPVAPAPATAASVAAAAPAVAAVPAAPAPATAVSAAPAVPAPATAASVAAGPAAPTPAAVALATAAAPVAAAPAPAAAAPVVAAAPVGTASAGLAPVAPVVTAAPALATATPVAEAVPAAPAPAAAAPVVVAAPVGTASAGPAPAAPVVEAVPAAPATTAVPAAPVAAPEAADSGGTAAPAAKKGAFGGIVAGIFAGAAALAAGFLLVSGKWRKRG
ncbi:MAG: hypothetical protein LBS06_02275, partial [Treponema sp.]|nr:hypothetical protein [Treponema sp.]